MEYKKDMEIIYKKTIVMDKQHNIWHYQETSKYGNAKKHFYVI